MSQDHCGLWQLSYGTWEWWLNRHFNDRHVLMMSWDMFEDGESNKGSTTMVKNAIGEKNINNQQITYTSCHRKGISKSESDSWYIVVVHDFLTIVAANAGTHDGLCFVIRRMFKHDKGKTQYRKWKQYKQPTKEPINLSNLFWFAANLKEQKHLSINPSQQNNF